MTASCGALLNASQAILDHHLTPSSKTDLSQWEVKAAILPPNRHLSYHSFQLLKFRSQLRIFIPAFFRHLFQSREIGPFREVLKLRAKGRVLSHHHSLNYF